MSNLNNDDYFFTLADSQEAGSTYPRGKFRWKSFPRRAENTENDQKSSISRRRSGIDR